MAVEALQCKECSERTRWRPATCASSASGRWRWPTTSAGSTPSPPGAGSRPARRTSGATPTSCRSSSPPKTALAAGVTPLVRADRLAERLGLGEVWVKNDAANPTHSFKDRVVTRGAGEGARAGLRGGGLRLHRQPRQRRGRARRRGRPGVVRVRARRPRGAEDPRHRRLRHQPGGRERQLRRRQPALHGAVGRARLGVRERERPPLLRRGLEDARLRDRRAARLRAARPRGGAGRLRLAVHQDRPRLRGVARGRPARGRPAGRSTAPRPRAARRSRRPATAATTSAGR